jgi:acyl-CoA thioesterase FadM
LPRVVYANHVTRAHVKYDDKARFDDKFHAHVAQTWLSDCTLNLRYNIALKHSISYL